MYIYECICVRLTNGWAPVSQTCLFAYLYGIVQTKKVIGCDTMTGVNNRKKAAGLTDGMFMYDRVAGVLGNPLSRQIILYCVLQDGCVRNKKKKVKVYRVCFESSQQRRREVL